jgi:hypothetical protein
MANYGDNTVTINERLDELIRTIPVNTDRPEERLGADKLEAESKFAVRSWDDNLRDQFYTDGSRRRNASPIALVGLVTIGLGLSNAVSPRRAIHALQVRKNLRARKLGGCGTTNLSKQLVGKALLVAERMGLVRFASTRLAKQEEPGGTVRHHYPYLTLSGVLHHNAILQVIAERDSDKNRWFDNPEAWGNPLPLPTAEVPRSKNFAEKNALKTAAQTPPPAPTAPSEPVSPRAAFVLGSGDPQLSPAKKIAARTADGTEYVFSCAKDAAEFERLRRDG